MKTRLSRRRFAASAASAAAALPLAAHNHPAQPSPLPEKSSPLRVFDPPGFRTIAELSDAIIPRTDTPGAADARVPEHLDQLLDASPLDVRRHFLEGLWSWQAFRRDHKDQSLAALATQALADETHPQHAFVLLAKTYTARIYYATEAGHRELDKGGRTPAVYF